MIPIAIPNIYAGPNYKRIIIIPFIFILLSLYFVPKIPAGIDLRGGILITLQTNSTVNATSLETALSRELGVHDVSISTAPGPLGGTGVEVEIEQNENLSTAERTLRTFYEDYTSFSSADFDALSFRSQLEHGNLTDEAKVTAQTQLADAESRRNASLAAVNAEADTIFTSIEPFTGQIDRSNATSPTALRDLLTSSYSQAQAAYRDRVLGVLRSQLSFTDFTYKEVSPSLSEFFLQKTIQVVIFSFLFTTIVVVVIFRSFVPSVAVIFGAMNDIIIALGAMGLFGIPMTLASLGALLMLIGFSLDTDMLVSIRVLKREEGNPRDRAYSAMKTGLTMSATGMIAFGVLLVVSILLQLPTYFQISTVVLAGLVGDVIATWCTDAVLVLWYMEGRRK